MMTRTRFGLAAAASAVLLGTLATARPATATTVSINPDANAAGTLNDPGATGTPTTVSTAPSESHVGNYFGNSWQQTVAEFTLPTAPTGQRIVVTKATVRFWGNGAPAYYGSRINADLFGYFGTQADGAVGVADAGVGADLGQLLSTTTDLTAYSASSMPPGSVAYVEKDVTALVQQAFDGSTNGYVGFRVQSADDLSQTSSPSVWRLRSTGFSDSHYFPSLSIEYQVVPAPEPATVGLIAAGAPLVLGRRRPR